MRDLPSVAIAAAQWLTTRHVVARVCMYPTDRPTFFRCAHNNSKTLRPISVIQTLSESFWDGLTRSKFCLKKMYYANQSPRQYCQYSFMDKRVGR